MTNNNKITYKDVLTQDLLLDLLAYDKETGQLTWKERDRKYFKDDGEWKRFNILFANTVAGSKTKNGHGYIKITILGFPVSAHRLILMMENGVWPTCADHINGVRDDNRWINLRSATYSDNNRNQRLHKENKSGYPGVYWHSRINKKGVDIGYWRAQAIIKKDDGTHTRKNLGNYKDLDEAINAKKDWDEANGYHPNHGRIIK